MNIEQGSAYASIAIPTKNAGEGFRKTLEHIFLQRAPFTFEVLVVDSGSVDQTLPICKEFPVQVLTIPPEHFNHGETRNYAIRNTCGNYVVLTVQDALPENEHWLTTLVSALETDSTLAGAYSRQVARPDAPFVVRRQVELWHQAQAHQTTRRIQDPTAFESMSLNEKRMLCAFDNVSSAIRRSVWNEVRFPRVPFGEDLAWSLAVLEKGYGIAYTPESVIVHSHSRPSNYNLRRAYADRKLLFELFGNRPNASLLRHILSLGKVMAALRRDLIPQKEPIVRTVVQGWRFYSANFTGMWLAEAHTRALQRDRHCKLWDSLDRRLAGTL